MSFWRLRATHDSVFRFFEGDQHGLIVARERLFFPRRLHLDISADASAPRSPFICRLTAKGGELKQVLAAVAKWGIRNGPNVKPNEKFAAMLRA